MAAKSSVKLSRSLVDPETDKIWRGFLSGTVVQIETGNPTKPRQQAKQFKTAEEASEYLQKQQWTKLKAGFVLHDPAATAGEPVLHKHVGSGYTGVLELAKIPEGLLTIRYEGTKDQLWKLDDTGRVELSVDVPKEMSVSDMVYSAEQERLLLNADLSILAWDPKKPKKFQTITGSIKDPASYLSVAGSRLAYSKEPLLIVEDMLTGKRIFEMECEPELYGGHTTQLCAALTRDGSRLAVCSKTGELSLFDVAKGKLLGQIQAKFKIIQNMEFDLSGNSLIGYGLYDPWGLLFFDMKAMKLAKPPARFPKLREGEIDFSLHPDRPWLAVSVRGDAHVFDLKKSQLIAKIQLEHVVKRAGVLLYEDKLAVRTDYGCLSVYRVE